MCPIAPLLEPMRPICPFLPQSFPTELSAAHIQAFKKERSERFYHTLLEYAQKLWLDGLPAQSLLMINRALSCALPNLDLNAEHASPFRAVLWILNHREFGGFIGNPRRHYQHLATRMVEPHKSLRVARAWACWHLAKSLLPDQSYPPDVMQIWKERLVEPTYKTIANLLQAHSPTNDLEAWKQAQQDLPLKNPRSFGAPASWQAKRVSDPSQLSQVTSLAHQIWPKCYGQILSQEQMDYMLEKGYSPQALFEQYSNPQLEFWLTFPGHTTSPDGFFSFEIHEAQGSAFLHKLYLSPTAQGSGRGAAALSWLKNHFQTRGLHRMQLRVNKRNYPAITAYTRAGMHIIDAVTVDIGGSYVMDDYVLEQSW